MTGFTVPAERAGWRHRAATSVLVVFAVVSMYEAAIALELIPIGDEPGENAFGGDVARAAGLLSMLVGLIVVSASIRAAEAISRLVRQLLPLVAASVVVSTGYAFDPYFSPTLRRYSDSGGVPAPAWMLVVVAVAVLAAGVSTVDARRGMFATAVVLVLCLGTLVFTGTGH